MTYNKMLGEIEVPIGEKIHGKRATFIVAVWQSRTDSPEGERTEISFSVPRNMQHLSNPYPVRTQEWYEARDVFNGWKHGLLTTFLAWHDKQTARAANIGGSIVRLVKKSIDMVPPPVPAKA